MGEENRGSSSGSTTMIVVVILGVLLLLGCSCGGIIVGVSLFVHSRAAQEDEMERAVRERELKSMGEKIRQDMETIKSLQAKYGKDFYPVGINLDNDPKDAAGFLRSKNLAWPHLFEDGGLDSRLAKEMGILTLPTMILVGKDGKALNRSTHAGELDAELKKLLR